MVVPAREGVLGFLCKAQMSVCAALLSWAGWVLYVKKKQPKNNLEHHRNTQSVF